MARNQRKNHKMEEKDIIIRNLIDTLNAYEGGEVLIANQGQALDGFSALATFVSIATRARKLFDKKES